VFNLSARVAAGGFYPPASKMLQHNFFQINQPLIHQSKADFSANQRNFVWNQTYFSFKSKLIQAMWFH